MRAVFLAAGEGLRDALKNPLRSFITVLATLLTAASIVVTMSLVEGTVKDYRAFLKSIGGVEVVKVQNSGRLLSREERRELSPGLTMLDVKLIRANVSSIEHVAPVIFTWAPFPVEFQGSAHRNHLVATEPDYFFVNRKKFSSGRAFTQKEVETSQRVIVLGSAAASRLRLDANNMKDATVKISQYKFRVIGILEPFAMWMDPWVYIPMTTFLTHFRTSRIVDAIYEPAQRRLDEIVIRVRAESDINRTISSIRDLLLLTHNGVEDFGFETREDWSENVEERVKGSEATGLFIVLVCLAVATLSVANVLLAALRQRVREIGIRMSVGCEPWQVFVQVLMESLVLCLMGCVLGLMLGTWLVDAMNTVSPTVLPKTEWQQKVLVFVLVMSSGIAAGLLPALRGAGMHPVKALQSGV